MLGLLVIGTTVFMIYTLVKNALFGKQISSSDHFSGTIDLLLPIDKTTHFSDLEWGQSLTRLQGTNLRIHVLVDGHHPEINSWHDLSRSHAMVEVQNFLTRPSETDAPSWMLQQLAHRLQGDVVIIGDPNLIPSESLFSSLAKMVKDKERVYMALPQTQKKNVLGESIALLNPTLAFMSFFGSIKLRKNLSSPFLAIADGWFAFPATLYKSLTLNVSKDEPLKLKLLRACEAKSIGLHLAFGEKHLLRTYPDNFEAQLQSMKAYWAELWEMKDRKPFWFFTAMLFIWSFPVVFLFTHPIWAFAGMCAIGLYRFFTKIVFQESWLAVFLHFLASLLWLGTLFWWLGTSARTPKSSGV